MNDHSYSQDFVAKTESRIKKQLEGNGVDPASIELKVKRQGTEILKGQTSFTLDCRVETQQSKGKKTKGRLIKSGDLQNEIKSYKASFTDREIMATAAKDAIKSLPLQGFGAEKATVDLPGEKLVLTEHVNCGTCRGQGQTLCPKCQGQTNVKCPKCYGRGDLQCEICLGHGKTQEGNVSKTCYNCQGKGEVFCYRCQGKRFIPCTNCHMKGKIACSACGGEGANSVHATLSPFMITTSAIHIQDLEAEPKRMVGKIGGLALAKGGHIDVKTVKPPVIEEEVERAYFEEAPPDPAKNSVFYEAEFPWAVAEININGIATNISFAGKKGAVCESGHFMEQLIQPYLEKLDRALRKQEDAHSAIKDACSLRVSRETFSLLGKTAQKKVMQEIHARYPLGLSKSYIQTFVTTAYKALKIATRRPRYIGLASGLALSTVINYIWFASGFDPLPASVPQEPGMIVPLVAGTAVTLIGIKLIGFITYHKLMSDIGIKSKRTPPMGKAGIYGVLGNLAIYGGFAAARLFNLY